MQGQYLLFRSFRILPYQFWKYAYIFQQTYISLLFSFFRGCFFLSLGTSTRFRAASMTLVFLSPSLSRAVVTICLFLVITDVCRYQNSCLRYSSRFAYYIHNYSRFLCPASHMLHALHSVII